MHIYHIIVSKFLKDCNERFQTVFLIFWSILVFCKRNSECYSNWSEKPTNMESPRNVLKIYMSKALDLLNKNLVILGAPKQRNCLLPTSKVCFQVYDSESHKPAFSSTSLNCRSLKEIISWKIQESISAVKKSFFQTSTRLLFWRVEFFLRIFYAWYAYEKQSLGSKESPSIN